MVDQNKLSAIFEAAEKHRLNGNPPVEGWGSSRNLDKDALWDLASNTHWERDQPNGEWYKVPLIGSDTWTA